MRPVVALLSDFGTRDHYAGAMKAVVLGICPDASLVDITHEIPPHDVLGGALELAACYRYFPRGTIFLAVVDPGVGSSRRGLAAETADYQFVGPDNGILTGVFRERAPKKAVELGDRKYARATVSRTFEGRDRFAPAAGWLAKGTTLSAFGRPITDYRMLTIPEPRQEPDRLVGEVLRVDRFGNLISNIGRRTFDTFAAGRAVSLTLAGHDVSRIVATYAEAPPASLCALFGSTDHLEVAIHGGSAADALQQGRGAPLVILV